MSNIQEQYNKIIKWLENYYEGLGHEIYSTFRGLEYSKQFITDVEEAEKEGTEFIVDPKLPIDFVAVKTEEEARDDKPDEVVKVNYYQIFWIVSPDDQATERRLQFYRFYLSRISWVKAIEFIIVVPADIESESEKKITKIAEDNGFGLWKVETTKAEPDLICSSKDYGKHMEDSLISPKDPKMEHFDTVITDKAEDLSLFFESFVREAVEALAGLTPKRYGRRYIERKLLDKVFDLENIKYAEELKYLVATHLINKGSDYEFVSSTFSTLWKKCELGIDYNDFLKTFEPPLLNIFAGKDQPYRDHYIHQFQVFLLGLHIIDKLRTIFPEEIDRLWLITASFHDMAYPLQKYDSWAQSFFKESLGIESIGVSDIKSNFVEGSLLASMGDIINALCKGHFNGELRGNWLQEEQSLIRFFHERITQRKHHCILSSLSLLKRALLVDHSLRETLFVPSALAIALHHDVVWRELPTERHLNSLKFSNDPLAFLLMFCDCVQEWGRPKTNESSVSESDEEFFLFEDCNVTDSKCTVTIYSPYLSRTQQRFKDKGDELDNLEAFLQSPPEAEFWVTLKDKFGAKSEHHMIGSNT